MLKLEQVTKYRGTFGLEDISFHLPEGYIMGLIGANGAGKTTLIHLIMNLLNKNAGKIEIFGLDNVKDEKKIKNQIGFVYDENCFYEYLSIKNMSKILSKFYSRWDRKIYRDLLQRMELDENEKIKNLSKGMKMKYSIVTALCHHARLILMDEPTAGLDPIVRREVLHLFQEYLEKEKASILFSTHLTSDLDKVADYLTFVKDGRLIFSKSTLEVQETFVLIKGSNSLFDERIRKLCKGYEQTSLSFSALLDKRELSNFDLNSLMTEIPTIEDIMYFYDRKKGGEL